uniref:Uncharacterized protein n=1 Tax=Arundo donax TaxID=35708 RepID=A0A0A9A7E7_ARUDO
MIPSFFPRMEPGLLRRVVPRAFF